MKRQKQATQATEINFELILCCIQRLVDLISISKTGETKL